MKSRNFIIIVIGQIISLLGNAIQRFCMSLFVLELTGSAAIFSAILAISTIPYILFAPMAGLLADTINRKKLMICLDLFSALIMAFFTLIIGRYDNTIVIAGVMFLLSIIYTLYSPSVSACIPQIVAKEELISANGIISQVGYFVNFAGPILGGVLYSFIDIKMIVVINAASFLFAAIMELFLNIPDLEVKEKIQNPLITSIREMKRSFLYLKDNNRVVLGIISSYAMINIFVVPVLSVVSPYFINVRLDMDPKVYGYVEAVFVSGMIIGGMLVTLRPKLFSMRIIHKTMYPMVLAMIVMGLATNINLDHRLIVLLLYAVGGLAIMLSLALSNIISLTHIQQSVRTDMLGKVSAFSTAIATASVAPGQILYGQLIEFDLSLLHILIITFLFSLLVVGFMKRNVRNLPEEIGTDVSKPLK
jgi:MFS family permease